LLTVTCKSIFLTSKLFCKDSYELLLAHEAMNKIENMDNSFFICFKN
jgi:hypothetical protein